MLLALLTAFLPSKAIEPYWNIDFSSVFDNREGDKDITATKTYFFTNLAPEVGVTFNGGQDRLAGGVVWHQPIGSEWDGHRISPTLYYRHEQQSWRFSMGMFPRRQLIEEMPGFLWSDSLSYHQNNIRGVLVQYVGEKGYFDAYVDWRGMQSRKQREAFNIVFHGQMSPRNNWFGFGAYAQMNHYALQKNAPADQHIVDNFLVNPYLAADLGSKTALDSLNIRAGLLMTIERNRAVREAGWKTPAGIYLSAVGEWKWFGVKNTLYAGGELFPSYNYPGAHFADDSAPHATEEDLLDNPVVYSILGPGLYQGEPFYRKKFYDRLDIYGYILRNDHVSLQASLNFNFTPGSMIFYQRLLLRITLP